MDLFTTKEEALQAMRDADAEMNAICTDVFTSRGRPRDFDASVRWVRRQERRYAAAQARRQAAEHRYDRHAQAHA